jgi:hypothetical protein
MSLHPFFKLWQHKIDHFDHFLSVKFSGIEYSQIVLQPTAPSTLEHFHHPELKTQYLTLSFPSLW